MVWYGMVWYDVIWYGTVGYDIVRYDIGWYSMVYNMKWYGMVWYGMVGLVHLTRPNATKILVGADGHGSKTQTNGGTPSYLIPLTLFCTFCFSSFHFLCFHSHFLLLSLVLAARRRQTWMVLHSSQKVNCSNSF